MTRAEAIKRTVGWGLAAALGAVVLGLSPLAVAVAGVAAGLLAAFWPLS